MFVFKGQGEWMGQELGIRYQAIRYQATVIAKEHSDCGNLTIDCFVSWRRFAMPRKNVQATIVVAAPLPL